MISYAQNYEDVLLARLFQGQSEGFYIDVGAWHPTLHSVTKHFYNLGWHGINIEPVLRQYRLFVDDRPRDRNLNVAVADVAGQLRFHECTDLTSLSTASEEQAHALRLAGHEIESYEVPVLTLGEIMASCRDRVIDFLKVDVEGFEASVLRGVDWRQHRPRILLIEATLPAVKIEDWDSAADIRNWETWEPALLAAGYQFGCYDGLSRFYVRNEDENIKARLALPPCVHDAFDLAEVFELKRQQKAMVKEREDVLAVNHRLETELRAVQLDRAEKSDVIDRLVAEAPELKRQQRLLIKDREDVLAVNHRLATELRAVELDRAEKSDVINRLAENLEHLVLSQTILGGKLDAKDQVIESMACRDLERKALLGGFADLAYYSRRQHVPPGYGDLFPPADAAQGRHIAIDTLEIVFGVSGGVETYMKMLTSVLLDGRQRVTLICLPDQLAALRKLFQARVGYFVVRQSQAIGLSTKLSRHLQGRDKRLSANTSMATFSRLREDIGADVLHSPVQIFSKLDFRIPAVLNLHDLQHLHFPENFTPSDIEARNHLYGLSATLADAIIVSSDFVRNDLVNQMKVPPAKVYTVPVTWDPMVIEGLKEFSVQDAASRYKLPPQYAIYPAQFWPHKNHARLVRALRIVRDARPSADLKLVFTGYRGHSGWPKVQAAIQAQGLDADVICLDHVPVNHLAALYKGAIYCVMPSTFEASSYPVIEAQVLGVPAMCSNVTSLPELMRDGAGLLFDPLDSEDIAAKMLLWLDDGADRLACAGRAQSKALREHSLANYAAGVARVYDHVIAAQKER